MAVQRRNSELVDLLTPDFIRRKFPITVADGFIGALDAQFELEDGTTVTVTDSDLLGLVDLVRYDADVTADTAASRSTTGALIRGESVNIFDISGDTVQLRLTAGGEVELQRTAVSAVTYYALTLRLHWIRDVNSVTSSRLTLIEDRLQAKDGDGLTMVDDGGNLGMFIEDGGLVGVGTAAPDVRLHIGGSTGELLRLDDSSATGSPFLSFYQSTTRRSYIAHIDTGDELRLASEYGTMAFWTGTGGTEVLRATFGTDGHLTFEDGLRILVDEVRARDSGGLFLRDDSGTLGIFVEDGGQVGVGESAPATSLHVTGDGIRVQRSTGAAFIQLGLTGSTTDGGSIYGLAGAVGMSFHSGFGGTERMRINADGQVGIGVTSFTGGLTVGNGRAQFTSNTAPTTGVGIEIGHDATTGIITSFSRDASTYKALRLNALNHDFYLSGSVAAVLDSSGNFGIGDSTPDGKLDVSQASTTAAIPVVELNQADLSEEFINFISTVGTGNPIEAVGAKTLTTTHFLRIQIDGVGYRYIPVGTIA